MQVLSVQKIFKSVEIFKAIYWQSNPFHHSVHTISLYIIELKNWEVTEPYIRISHVF